MNNLLFILAGGQPGQEGGQSMIPTLIMFAAIFLIFYFLIIRPQQKRQKEREKMLSEVQKGDKVLLSGGIHGTVVQSEEKTFLVQIDTNVKVKVEKAGVTQVLEKGKS